MDYQGEHLLHDLILSPPRQEPTQAQDCIVVDKSLTLTANLALNSCSIMMPGSVENKIGKNDPFL